MIEKSRKREASSSMKTIYLITVASMFGASVPYFWRALRQGTNYVMKVNGVGITATEFGYNVHKEKTLLSIIRERSGVYYEQMLQLLGKSEQVEANVIEQLIIQKLMLWDANRMGLAISPSFAARELCSAQIVMSVLGEFIPSYIFNEQGSLNYEQLAQFLSRQGLTMAQFEAMIDDHLLIGEVVRLMRGTAVLSNAGRTLALVPRFSTRTFQAEVFALQPFIDIENKKDISNEQLQSFFAQENRKFRRYWSPELRSGTVWSFDGERYLKRHEEEAEESKQQKDESREQKFERIFRIETDQILLSKSQDGLRRFIEESLGKKREIAKVSRDKEAKDALVAALFSLDVPGARTAVVQGMKGYIVELNDVTQPEERTFEKVAEKVQADYREQQARLALKQAIMKADVNGVSKTFVVTPGQQSLPEDISSYGIDLANLESFVVPGQAASGVGAQGGYRMVLKDVSKLSEELLQKEGGMPKIMLALERESGELVVRQLVASLRNHAILSDVQLGRNE